MAKALGWGRGVTVITGQFLLGRRRAELSEDEKEALEKAVDAVVTLPARQLIVPRLKPVDTSMLLLEGLMCSYMDASDGERQLVGLHVPGDPLDLHSFPLKMIDHDLGTLTECRVAQFKHSTIERLDAEMPHLGRMLWFATLLDAAMHREWIFRLGRLSALGRVAHFFSETERRLRFVGLSDGERFDLPLQQADLASVCGITPVHTNRVLRELRERRILTFGRGVVQVGDLKLLNRIGEFEDGYLYPEKR